MSNASTATEIFNSIPAADAADFKRVSARARKALNRVWLRILCLDEAEAEDVFWGPGQSRISGFRVFEILDRYQSELQAVLRTVRPTATVYVERDGHGRIVENGSFSIDK